jgi:hypothetical protein
VEALDKITNILLRRYCIRVEDMQDVRQEIAVGIVKGGKACSEYPYLFQCGKYSVIRWIRKQAGWNNRLSLDAPITNDTDTTMLDMLCCHRGTPYQILNAKQQAVVDSELSEAMAEYDKIHKPFKYLSLLSR